MPQPRTGYTLPAFACASAVAALRHLHQESLGETIAIDLLEPPQIVEIPLEQVAKMGKNVALAITRSDPGDNLDLTRHTPVWALVEIERGGKKDESITIQGGEGIGKQLALEGRAAIYQYARRLLQANLERLRLPGEHITATIILPEGRRLAERTSNAAFGVVEGLSLLGTSGISQPLSAPAQLAVFQSELADKADNYSAIVFCIGENGLDLAQNIGINPERRIKAANWLGPLLVAAGLQGVREILLFGYHGKLLKLAGGIFHTHHHLADGRLEILTAHAACLGLPAPTLQEIFTSPTAEAALQKLRSLDAAAGSDWVGKIYGAIAETIDKRSQVYIHQHAEREVTVGCVLFDRNRILFAKSQQGAKLLENLKSKI
jgi:cobalt-precorrin-5B (C1)-methyltransferase